MADHFSGQPNNANDPAASPSRNTDPDQTIRIKDVVAPLADPVVRHPDPATIRPSDISSIAQTARDLGVEIRVMSSPGQNGHGAGTSQVADADHAAVRPVGPPQRRTAPQSEYRSIGSASFRAATVGSDPLDVSSQIDSGQIIIPASPNIVAASLAQSLNAGGARVIEANEWTVRAVLETTAIRPRRQRSLAAVLRRPVRHRNDRQAAEPEVVAIQIRTTNAEHAAVLIAGHGPRIGAIVTSAIQAQLDAYSIPRAVTIEPTAPANAAAGPVSDDAHDVFFSTGAAP